MRATIGLVYLGLFFGSLVGYVLNIAAIVHAINGPLTAMLAVRLVGVIAAPLGAVLGYF